MTGLKEFRSLVLETDRLKKTDSFKPFKVEIKS